METAPKSTDDLSWKVRDSMRRIIILLVTALISVLSLSAAEVFFHVPSDTILTYCDESFVPNGDGVIALNLSEENTATIQTENGKEISVTFINTEEALVKWSLSSPEDVKLRYSLNDTKPKSLKKGSTELNLKKLPMNELTLFTLEARSKKGEWYECGRAGIIPVVLPIAEEEPVTEEKVPVEMPELKGESEIRYVDAELVPKEISHYYDRKIIFSGYFMGSMQVLSFSPDVMNIGMGAKASVTLPLTQNLSFVTDVNYQWIKYSARDFNECALNGKLRLSSSVRESGIVFIQLGGGENFVFHGSDKAYYPMATVGVGMELYFTKNIGLSLIGEYSASFQRDSINSHFSACAGLSLAFGKEV